MKNSVNSIPRRKPENILKRSGRTKRKACICSKIEDAIEIMKENYNFGCIRI
ncbi:MAG: hypothetical protein ACTSVV_10820 [Promethearchaeota archaeon]